MSLETAEITVKDKVNKIMAGYGYDKSMLVSILQDIQGFYKFLPESALEEVHQGLKVPLSQVYSVATFFKAFTLTPAGKHIINCCMGTACHVRGAVRVLEKIERELGIEAGETTKDLVFTIETVNCVGACALGPMVVIDGNYEGQMTAEKVAPVLKKYK